MAKDTKKMEQMLVINILLIEKYVLCGNFWVECMSV